MLVKLQLETWGTYFQTVQMCSNEHHKPCRNSKVPAATVEERTESCSPNVCTVDIIVYSRFGSGAYPTPNWSSPKHMHFRKPRRESPPHVPTAVAPAAIGRPWRTRWWRRCRRWRWAPNPPAAGGPGDATTGATGNPFRMHLWWHRRWPYCTAASLGAIPRGNAPEMGDPC